MLKQFAKKIIIKFIASVNSRALMKIIFEKLNKKSDLERLKGLFELYEMVDAQINQASVKIYKGKHPKHHLWTGLYKFVVNNVQEGSSVFDVGSGISCSYVQELAEKCKKIDSCDYVQERVDYSNKVNKFKNVKYFLLDITKDMPKEKYDVVIMSHVLEHLYEPEDVLERLKNVTKKVIIRLPRYDDHWMYLVKKDLGLPYFKDTDHKKEYILETAIELVEKSGWKVEQALNDIDIKIVATIK